MFPLWMDGSKQETVEEYSTTKKHETLDKRYDIILINVINKNQLIFQILIKAQKYFSRLIN